MKRKVRRKFKLKIKMSKGRNTQFLPALYENETPVKNHLNSVALSSD
jgi:hypothetical protein